MTGVLNPPLAGRPGKESQDALCEIGGGVREENGAHSSRSGLWFPFALDIIRSDLWRKLSKRAKAVYPVICAFADFKTGDCYPSTHTISRLSGIGRGWVSAAIDELVKAELIRRWSGKREGDSNRYKIVFWGCSTTEQGVPHNGAPGSSVAEQGGAPSRSINNIHVTNTNITTTTNNASRRRSRPSSDGDETLAMLTRELNLSATGVEQLQNLIEEFTSDYVKAACREAVVQGHPTLKYMGGILRNWARDGKISRASFAERRDERRAEERAAVRRTSADNETFRQRRAEASDQAKVRLAEVPLEELATWQKAEAAKAARAGLTGDLAHSYVESQVLIRVAEKFGIEGL